MSSSYVSGANSPGYVSLGGLFRTRIASSDNPALKTLATQLTLQDKRAAILQDVINPKGFTGLDGKTKYIPGISFSKKDNLFDAIKTGAEISDAQLKTQIDGYVIKRNKEKFDRLLVKDRKEARYRIFEEQRKSRSSRQKTQLAANKAFLEKAFGINKTKTERSNYTAINRPLDFQIFGSTSGHAKNFEKDYALNSDLISQFAPSISYSADSNVQTVQSVKIAHYHYTQSNTTPTGYVVRLSGDGKADPLKDNGSVLPTPTGSLSYVDSLGVTQNITGSTVTELTKAEFDTLEYKIDFTSRKQTTAASTEGTSSTESTSSTENTSSTQTASDVGKLAKAKILDFLSVIATAPDPVDPTKTQRSYTSKIPITRGDFTSVPSNTGEKNYQAKLSGPDELYFNNATIYAKGTFISDGSGSTNAADGTLLDMINEGRARIFAREIGYDTLMTVDVSKSKDNMLVLSKSNSKLVNSGLDFFVIVKDTERGNVTIDSLNMGLGKP